MQITKSYGRHHVSLLLFLFMTIMITACQPEATPQDTEEMLETTLEAEMQGVDPAEAQTTVVPPSAVETGENAVSVVGSVLNAEPDEAAVPNPIGMNLPLDQAGITLLDAEGDEIAPQYQLTLVGGIPEGVDESRIAMTVVFPQDLAPGTYALGGQITEVQLIEAFGGQYTPADVNATDYDGAFEVMPETVQGDFTLSDLGETASGELAFVASISEFVDEGAVEAIGDITVRVMFEEIPVVIE